MNGKRAKTVIWKEVDPVFMSVIMSTHDGSINGQERFRICLLLPEYIVSLTDVLSNRMIRFYQDENSVRGDIIKGSIITAMKYAENLIKEGKMV